MLFTRRKILRTVLFGFLIALMVASLSGCGDIETTEPLDLKSEKVPEKADDMTSDHMLYVVNRDSNNVQVIDPLEENVIDTIDVGEKPTYNQVSPNGKYLYVVNSQSNDLSIIEVGRNEVVKTIPVGKTPKGVNFTPDGKWAYVVNEGENTVTVIDAKTMEVAGEVETESFPHNVVASPDSRYAYVTNTGANTVTVIDTAAREVSGRIERVQEFPHNLTVTPDGKELWVTLTKSNAVAVLDLKEGGVTKTISVGKGHHVIDITPDGKYAYVGNIGEDTVSVMDVAAKKRINTIRVGKGPHGVTVSPDGEKVFVGVSKEHKVAVIDTSSGEVVNTIETDETPFFLTIHGAHGGISRTDSVTHEVPLVSHDHPYEHKSGGSEQGNGGEYTAESPLLAQDKTFSYTFKKEGEYAVHCDPHPYMTMNIVVKPQHTNEKAQNIEIRDYSFQPGDLEIAVGTTVTWTNQDGVEHTVDIEAKK